MVNQSLNLRHCYTRLIQPRLYGVGFHPSADYHLNPMQTKYPATPYVSDNSRISRRTLFKLGIATGSLTLSGLSSISAVASDGPRTPSQTEGPFYPIHRQQDKDTDLTLIEGHSETAKGEVIVVGGTVFDTHRNTLKDVFIDIWQANTWGRYRHSRDPNTAPLDPNFQGWAQTTSNDKGSYQFKTILPGAYPAGPGWTRPPHIHFKVFKQGFAPLTTQMYFEGQSLNKLDLILQHHSNAEQKMLTAKRTTNKNSALTTYRFDIVLQHD